MSSVLNQCHNPRKLVQVEYTSVLEGTSGEDFSNGFPFLYVSPAGVLHARLDDEAGYLFMSDPNTIYSKLSENMNARRQIKSIDSTMTQIFNNFMTGALVGSFSNPYVYRSAFASLYQATTESVASVPTLSTTPPVFVTGSVAAAAPGSQSFPSMNIYDGYTLPAHTFWACDTPLVIEFTDTGDSTVKYLTLTNTVTATANISFTTMN